MRVEERAGVKCCVIDCMYGKYDGTRGEIEVSAPYRGVRFYITEAIPKERNHLEGQAVGSLDFTVEEAREVALALLKAAKKAEWNRRSYE